VPFGPFSVLFVGKCSEFLIDMCWEL